MSGVAEAGLIFLVISVLMIIGAGRTRGRGVPIHNEDDETWWYARRSWWDDQR